MSQFIDYKSIHEQLTEQLLGQNKDIERLSGILATMIKLGRSNDFICAQANQAPYLANSSSPIKIKWYRKLLGFFGLTKLGVAGPSGLEVKHATDQELLDQAGLENNIDTLIEQTRVVSVPAVFKDGVCQVEYRIECANCGANRWPNFYLGPCKQCGN